jgi:hypothetical protein
MAEGSIVGRETRIWSDRSVYIAQQFLFRQASVGEPYDYVSVHHTTELAIL